MPYAIRAPGGAVWYTGGTTPSSGPVSASSARSGGVTIPVIFPSSLAPSSWYSVDGVMLDSQPTVCTAPLPQGNVIPAGSAFILEFQAPSVNTQALLTSGNTVSMTFLLYGGATVTGQVQLASTLSGSFLQVVCTVLANISLGS